MSLAYNITAQAATTATPNVTRNTVYTWQTSAGTGEGVLDLDPTNSSNMVYLAVGLPYSVPFFSSNGGSTWSKTPSFTINSESALLDPWMSYDSQGNVYAGTYMGNTTHPYNWLYPYIAKSVDHGASYALLSTSYSPPSTQWTMPDGTLKPSCAIGPLAIDFTKVAADKSPSSPFHDYLYIVGSAGVNSTGSSFCAGETSFIRSSDGGATWDIHRVLAGQDGQVIVRPDNLVVAPNGTIYFAVTYTGGGVLLVYSKDAGVTWSTRAIPLGFGTGDDWVAVSKVNSDNLYVAFERILPDNSIHIYMISSTTGGSTWSSPVRLDDVLSNDVTDHTLPSMDASPGGSIFVAWRDYRNTPTRMASKSNTTDIYAYSSINPTSNIRISNSTGRLCGPAVSCYSVDGNDYFEVVSGSSADYVTYSLDENADSWPEAYAAFVTYTTTGFTLSASSTSLSNLAGASGTSTITVKATNGFTGTVNLATTILPASGLTCTLSPTSVILGTQGTSTLSCAGSVGVYTVVITGTSGSTSNTARLIVSVQDFSVTANPTSVSVNTGTMATSTITVGSMDGFAGTVTLATTTNSTNLVCNLSPSSISGGSGTSILSCYGSLPGNYFTTVAGTSGSLSHSASVIYNVRDFTITANVTGLTVLAGALGSSTITVTQVNGFTGTVALSSAVNSTGLTCIFSSTSIAGGSGTTKLSCTGSAGHYLVVVTGTNAGLAHTVQVAYRVQDFAMVASSTSVTIPLGGTGNSTISISSVNSFSGTVGLTFSIAPGTGLSCTLSPTSISGGSGESTLSCNGSAGTYNVTVTGIGDYLSHSTTVSYHQAGRWRLEVVAPSSGVLVTIDGVGWTTDTSGRVSVEVGEGIHAILVQPTIPSTIGPLSQPLGVAETFSVWNDGNANNPRWINVSQDTVLIASYRTTLGTSFYGLTAVAVALGLVPPILLYKRRRRQLTTSRGKTLSTLSARIGAGHGRRAWPQSP